MLLTPRLQILFLINATVLITHQIDAAYWHEWELFHLPGGNQVNLLLNLPIIALVLYAQGRVAINTKASVFYYKLIAFLGFLTVTIHGAFFIAGNGAFVQPMSVALLIATSVLSGMQFFLLRRETA
ncbi:DUF6713 family protein [Undibacterium pigrum]|uniref:Uncharacterized protein n=1 Tax=Undibacterium pigrum TaxID=401470 RepID=A0A318IWK3_9BURK|nr:DUF6713 family protein [Undibacterium pigrum]PXX39695.1 hypothetical protein DFR42_11060 [Undibacterium pigrum]